MSTDNHTLYLYLREDGVQDGTLMDVTPTSKLAGIRHPTARTREVWQRYVQVPEGLTQGERYRLWAIIWTLRHAIKHAHRESVLLFPVPVRNDRGLDELVTLKAFGCLDESGPSIIVLLPEEG